MITHCCGKEDFSGTFDVSDWHFGECELINKKALTSSVSEALNNSLPDAAFFDFDDDDTGGFSFGFLSCFGYDKTQKWDVTFDQLAEAIVDQLDDDRDAIDRVKRRLMEIAELVDQKYQDRIKPKTSKATSGRT